MGRPHQGAQLQQVGLALAFALLSGWSQGATLEKVTINYATRTGTTWPLYIAKEGGYFEKYGLDATIVFGVHPAGIAMIVSGEAAMTNYPSGAGHAGQFQGWVAGDSRESV